MNEESVVGLGCHNPSVPNSQPLPKRPFGMAEKGICLYPLIKLSKKFALTSFHLHAPHILSTSRRRTTLSKNIWTDSSADGLSQDSGRPDPKSRVSKPRNPGIQWLSHSKPHKPSHSVDHGSLLVCDNLSVLRS